MFHVRKLPHLGHAIQYRLTLTVGSSHNYPSLLRDVATYSNPDFISTYGKGLYDV